MRRAKENLRCQHCGARVGARVNYCGNCGAAVSPVPLQPIAAPQEAVWPQYEEAMADPVDWPLPAPDKASAPTGIDEGIDQEPTIPSLVGPGSLIMPPLQPPMSFAPSAMPQAMPQAISQPIPSPAPELSHEFAAQVAAQVAAHIAATPQITPAQAAAPLVASAPLVTSHPLASSTPLVMTAPSMRTRARFLSALLELITPGLGIMYLGSFWLGRSYW